MTADKGLTGSFGGVGNVGRGLLGDSLGLLTIDGGAGRLTYDEGTFCGVDMLLKEGGLGDGDGLFFIGITAGVDFFSIDLCCCAPCEDGLTVLGTGEFLNITRRVDDGTSGDEAAEE